MSDLIVTEISEGVAKISLNRPEKYHSFNREMALALQETLKECAVNDAVRSIYLTASGKAFCAGQDLGEAIDPNAPDLVKIVQEHYNPIVLLLRSIEKPIVCGVNGVAAGAGANVALACDITVATKSATFIQAFSSIGLIPDSAGTYYLPRLVGMQKAAALAFLADKVTAEEAANMNMIYKAFSDETFEEEAYAIAQKLARLPTTAIGLTKRLFNEGWNNDLPTHLEREAVVQAESAQSTDHKEGISAFLEKRKPNFTGK